jgi:hypothetical protein
MTTLLLVLGGKAQPTIGTQEQHLPSQLSHSGHSIEKKKN